MAAAVVLVMVAVVVVVVVVLVVFGLVVVVVVADDAADGEPCATAPEWLFWPPPSKAASSPSPADLRERWDPSRGSPHGMKRCRLPALVSVGVAPSSVGEKSGATFGSGDGKTDGTPAATWRAVCTRSSGFPSSHDTIMAVVGRVRGDDPPSVPPPPPAPPPAPPAAPAPTAAASPLPPQNNAASLRCPVGDAPGARGGLVAVVVAAVPAAGAGVLRVAAGGTAAVVVVLIIIMSPPARSRYCSSTAEAARDAASLALCMMARVMSAASSR